ncbi:MAG: EamA family transporter [Corynebacteriales bacterium]|nr:EamA family transporter [Mycobacteriales bacterium]
MVSVSAVLFAINGVVSKVLINAGFSALQLTTVRTAAGFACLATYLGLTRAKSLQIRRRELPWLAGYGVIGLFLSPLCYFLAISRLPISIGLLLQYTAPVFIAIWARFAQGRPVRSRLWWGLSVCLAGVILVVNALGDLRIDIWGVAAGCGAALLVATYFVLSEKGVGKRDTLSLMCWAFAAAGLLGSALSPWWKMPWGALFSWEHPWTGTLALGYFVVFGSVLPYLLVIGAMRYLSATNVGILAMLEVVVATALAWIFLDESLTPLQIFGGALLLAGVIAAETARVPAVVDDVELAAPKTPLAATGTP